MRPTQPRSWILTLAICSALVYLALHYSPDDLTTLGDESVSQSHPETYLINMRDRSYSESGNLTHVLKASQVTYVAQEDGTLSYIEKPQLSFFREQQPQPWQLRADLGVASIDQHTLLLSGDVRAFSTHPRYGPVEVLTDDLQVDTEQQFARTDKPVTMRSTHGTTDAVGLEADLDSGRLQLLSEVKGTYVPN